MRLYGSDVPLWVRNQVSPEIVAILEVDNHGISYPCDTGIQTRAKRDKECIDSHYFSFSEHGCIAAKIAPSIPPCSLFFFQ